MCMLHFQLVLAVSAVSAVSGPLRSSVGQHARLGPGVRMNGELLLRTPVQPAGGMGCIPVPLERLLAPGCQREMHLYDTSCLNVFQSALRTGTTGQAEFGLVVLDLKEQANRRFRLEPVGCHLRILKWAPAEHTSKFGDSSRSVKAEVMCIGRFRPGSILQQEPFLSVQAAPWPAMEEEFEDASRIEKVCAQAEFCEGLREGLELPPTPTSDYEQALQVLETMPSSAAMSALALQAMACTRVLSGKERLQALQMGEETALVEFVELQVAEEAGRLLAMKAFRDVKP